MVLIFKSHSHLTLLQRDGKVSFFALPFLSVGMGEVCKTGFHYVSHVKLEFASFLPQASECWDYRSQLPYLAKRKF